MGTYQYTERRIVSEWLGTNASKLYFNLEESSAQWSRDVEFCIV